MPLPGQKMYVVTQPELIQLAQKQHRTLSFRPVAAKFASRICGTSDEAQRILIANVNGDEGEFGLYHESHEGINAALKPGVGLDGMNRVMAGEIAMALDHLQPQGDNPITFNLYGWLRDAITTATTKSVYGPKNPFGDKAVADAFWEFELGLMAVLVGFLPSLTARSALQARSKVAKAIEAYYLAGASTTRRFWRKLGAE